jgi:hypothetical protein
MICVYSRQILLKQVDFTQMNMLSSEGAMPSEEQMTVSERRKYFKVMKARSVGAKRGGRGRLLSEIQKVTGLYRKSLTRLMHWASLERNVQSG